MTLLIMLASTHPLSIQTYLRQRKTKNGFPSVFTQYLGRHDVCSIRAALEPHAPPPATSVTTIDQFVKISVLCLTSVASGSIRVLALLGGRTTLTLVKHSGRTEDSPHGFGDLSAAASEAWLYWGDEQL